MKQRRWCAVPRRGSREDKCTPNVGDTVITRRNDWCLRTGNGRDWVRNGESWTITGLREDGSAAIRKAERRFGSSIVLPAVYLAEHVDLG